MLKITCLLLTFVSTSALAANTSVYTALNDAKCQTVDKGTQGEEWILIGCPGYKNSPDYQVMLSEDDLRDSVSYGKNPRGNCSLRTTFSHFNSAGKTVEWRLHKGKPIATILRFAVSYGEDNPPKTADWLVVTKLEDGNSCAMAFVEGAMPKANEKSRLAADTLSPSFSCKTGAITIYARSKTDISSVPSGPACPPEAP